MAGVRFPRHRAELCSGGGLETTTRDNGERAGRVGGGGGGGSTTKSILSLNRCLSLCVCVCV